jgi:hypothetical protein
MEELVNDLLQNFTSRELRTLVNIVADDSNLDRLNVAIPERGYTANLRRKIQDLTPAASEELVRLSNYIANRNDIRLEDVIPIQ